MNQRPSSLFRVSYRMQRGDHVARIVALTRRPPSRALALAAVYYGLLLLLLLIRTESSAAFAADLLRLLTTPALLDILPYLLAGLLLLVPSTWPAALMATLAYRRSGIADQQVTLDVTTDGIEIRLAERASRISWAAVRRLLETPDHLLIQLSRREALIVPRRALPDEDRYRDLVGFIRARTGLSTGARRTQL